MKHEVLIEFYTFHKIIVMRSFIFLYKIHMFVFFNKIALYSLRGMNVRFI